MFIVFDRTWKRNLWYGHFKDEKKRVLLEAGDDCPVSVFRTKKDAWRAIDVTRAYTFLSIGKTPISPAWTKHDYMILPLKIQPKRKN